MSEINESASAPYRLPTGGRIDRGTTLRFTFAGRTLTCRLPRNAGCPHPSRHMVAKLLPDCSIATYTASLGDPFSTPDGWRRRRI